MREKRRRSPSLTEMISFALTIAGFIWIGAFKFSEVEHDISEINKRLDRIDIRLDKMDIRFDRMDARFDKMEEEFHKMDIRVNVLEHRKP